MPIAEKLKTFLDLQNIDHEVLVHPLTHSSMETAQSAHIKGRKLAKGVVVRDERGCLLVVLPATKHLNLDMLGAQLDRRLQLVPESALAALFPDCRPGAIPALGEPYGLDAVWDSALAAEDEIYFEAGDHEIAVRVSGKQFQQLLANARQVYCN
jgi:Ala-tRNA(Pro) deacylase